PYPSSTHNSTSMAHPSLPLFQSQSLRQPSTQQYPMPRSHPTRSNPRPTLSRPSRILPTPTSRNVNYWYRSLEGCPASGTRGPIPTRGVSLLAATLRTSALD
ncbi:hypothetical protein BGW39_008876, partial [Mortierella sp. 14UC]